MPDNPEHITEKLCTGPCARVRPLDDFVVHPLVRDGRHSRCRECRSLLAKLKRRERGLKGPMWATLKMDEATGRFVATQSFEERFWSKVQVCKHGRECRECCWPWTARITDGGYGQFGWREPGDTKKRNLNTHTIAFRVTFGYWPKPVGRHTCDVRHCCQPYHVIEGTHAQNSKDMTDRKRQAKGTAIGIAALTDNQVLLIRALHGVMYWKEIGPIFGISPHHVYKIWRRELWKHI